MEHGLMLMTAHGTIVCRTEDGGLCHVALEAIGSGTTPLMFDLHDIARSGRDQRMLTNTDGPLTLSDLAGLPAGCDMILDPGRRTAALRQTTRFYCAEPQNVQLACDRVSAGVWERFLFLTQSDRASIQHIMSNSWIQATTRSVLQPDTFSFAEGFILTLNGLRIDLRYNLPFMPHGHGPAQNPASASSYNVLVDGWRIERLYLFRPMIYMTVFGSPYVVDQAFTAIDSLVEFGGYKGRLHVITDQPKELFLENLPALEDSRLSVQLLGCTDSIGFAAAKYAILDHAEAWQFQPLLFLNTDIVCDAPIERLLAVIVTLDRMSAPLDDITPLQTSPRAGAALIQRAGLDAGFGCAVNEGILGIPNLQDYSELLELTRTIITNHVEMFGRDECHRLEQEALNYVSFQVGHYDTSSLLQFVRYGWAHEEFEGTRRLGLLHFRPAIAERPKEVRMHDYVATLRRMERA